MFTVGQLVEVMLPARRGDAKNLDACEWFKGKVVEVKQRYCHGTNDYEPTYEVHGLREYPFISVGSNRVVRAI